MTTTRTQDEILVRIKTVEKDDFFGFQTGDLIEFLTYENAKPWLKEGATAEQWKHLTDPVERLKDYMPFAWDKANDCRGLSAGRSLEHMKAWVWLDGNIDLLTQIEEDYEYYGKPHLVKICQAYGVDWKSLDSGEWVNGEDDTPKTADEVLKPLNIIA